MLPNYNHPHGHSCNRFDSPNHIRFPDLGGIQGLKESARLMKGNMWRYIKLNLSFVPLLFLSVFTFYIALFWIMPYMEMSLVTFYRDLNGELDHRLPGDGYYGGSGSFYNGYNAGSDDPDHLPSENRSWQTEWKSGNSAKC